MDFSIGFSSPPPHRWAGKTYTEMFFLVINQPCYMRMLFSHLSLGRMGYSHTLSRGRMVFLPREHHAPEAHRVQLEGRGGMMLSGEKTLSASG